MVVIGDREDWFSEEITFIEHNRVSDNAQVDTLAKLKVAMESPEVTGRFIWTNDDIYVMNPIDLAHVALPKVNGMLVPLRFKGLYAENMKRTKELLEKSQLPCLNYGTHTPMLLDKGCLAAMFERFPELEEGGYLFTSVYYNSLPYPTQPVYLNWPTDQVLLPVVSQKPDEKKVLDLLSRKVFMNNAVSGYSPWLEKFWKGCFRNRRTLRAEGHRWNRHHGKDPSLSVMSFRFSMPPTVRWSWRHSLPASSANTMPMCGYMPG